MIEKVRTDKMYKQNVIKRHYIIKTWDRETGDMREIEINADSMSAATLLVPSDFITNACRISLTEVNE